LEGPAVAEPFAFEFHLADYNILKGAAEYSVRARAPLTALPRCSILMRWLLLRTFKNSARHYQAVRKPRGHECLGRS